MVATSAPVGYSILYGGVQCWDNDEAPPRSWVPPEDLKPPVTHAPPVPAIPPAASLPMLEQSVKESSPELPPQLTIHDAMQSALSVRKVMFLRDCSPKLEGCRKARVRR